MASKQPSYSNREKVSSDLTDTENAAVIKFLGSKTRCHQKLKPFPRLCISHQVQHRKVLLIIVFTYSFSSSPQCAWNMLRKCSHLLKKNVQHDSCDECILQYLLPEKEITLSSSATWRYFSANLTKEQLPTFTLIKFNSPLLLTVKSNLTLNTLIQKQMPPHLGDVMIWQLFSFDVYTLHNPWQGSATPGCTLPHSKA